jgi:hypothetical protein
MHGFENLSLAFEIAVDNPRAQAKFACDIPNGGFMIPLFREALPGCRYDLPPAKF